MTHQPGEHPDRPVLFLQELVAEHATISGDILEVGAHTWAIHGSIAVDGDVIMAEYDTPDQARLALGKLSSADDETDAPSRVNRAENPTRGLDPIAVRPDRHVPQPTTQRRPLR